VAPWKRTIAGTIVAESTAALLASGSVQELRSQSRTAFSGRLPELDGQRAGGHDRGGHVSAGRCQPGASASLRTQALGAPTLGRDLESAEVKTDEG
jgi:hypothetical protein